MPDIRGPLALRQQLWLLRKSHHHESPFQMLQRLLSQGTTASRYELNHRNCSLLDIHPYTFAGHGVPPFFVGVESIGCCGGRVDLGAGSRCTRWDGGTTKPVATCQKKVGFTGFKCKCRIMFCGAHRYLEKHGCSFDFKWAGREEISRANPVVIAEKLRKI